MFSFALPRDFVDQYRHLPEPFGFGALGAVTFYRTYARIKDDGSLESWTDACERVINGMYSIQKDYCRNYSRPWSDAKALESAKEAFHRMFYLKWSPPGRGISHMGSPSVMERGMIEALQNCFSGDTKFLTEEYGVTSFNEVVGKPVTVWNGRQWTLATVKSFGDQDLNRVTFAPAHPNPRGDGFRAMRSNYRFQELVTPDHRWILHDGVETIHLNEGDVVRVDQLVYEKDENYEMGYLHGVIFGDGSKITHRYANGDFGYTIRGCTAKKRQQIESIGHRFDKVTYPQSANGDPIYGVRMPVDMKAVPSFVSPSYTAGFINGWCDMDGSVAPSGSVLLSTQNHDAVAWLEDNAALGGYAITGISSSNKATNYGPRTSALYSIMLSRGGFAKVVSIERDLFNEEVFCAVVPDGGQFALANGVVTGNCSMISTKQIGLERGNIYAWIMEMLMLGVGVGFDTLGAGKAIIVKPLKTLNQIYVIPDTREGWAESTKLLIDSYIHNPQQLTATSMWTFDYSKIRKKGEIIHGFGGYASGPEPLIDMHEKIRMTFESRNDGDFITSRDITDIANMIGCVVVAGNVRRSSEIALGLPDDAEFKNLKNYEMYPERAAHGWASNNSILANVGMDYSEYISPIMDNGEPGFVWLENIRKYARMNGVPDYRDLADGVNPCQPSFATVLTREGVKTFGDIGIGDEIWSESGWTKVTDKWSTGVKPVYASQFTGGVFVGTLNHRVVTSSGKQEVSEALDIHVLAGPEMIAEALDPQTIMDGLFFGDGYHKHMSGRGYTYPVLIIGEDDADYWESEINYLITGRFEDRGTAESVRVNTTISDGEMAKTYEKLIPDRFVRAKPKDVASFLRGLYSANGSVVNGEIRFKTTSRAMRDQVIIMLSSLGIRSRFTVNKSQEVNFDNGRYTCRESYDIIIGRRADVGIFGDKIGFIQKYKNEKLLGGVGAQKESFSKFVDSNYIGDFEVFDITVSNDTHTYWTGGVNVSNCGEQPLRGWSPAGVGGEMCTLVELYPYRHTSVYDISRSIKFAYLYGKTVTLLSEMIKHDGTRDIMMENRRIGLSMTGIAQYTTAHGAGQLAKMLSENYDFVRHYDKRYSSWFGVPESVRVTSVKPSGTVSLVAGATPGVHYPHSEFYIRRIRISDDSYLAPRLMNAGVHVEPDKYSRNTLVASFPIHAGIGIRSAKSLSIWEQLEMAAIMQRHWSDNAVSVTVSINPAMTSREELASAISMYQNSLKTVSFLPETEGGAYEQMPYEEITREAYAAMQGGINYASLSSLNQITDDTSRMSDKYCDGAACEIVPRSS